MSYASDTHTIEDLAMEVGVLDYPETQISLGDVFGTIMFCVMCVSLVILAGVL